MSEGEGEREGVSNRWCWEPRLMKSVLGACFTQGLFVSHVRVWSKSACVSLCACVYLCVCVCLAGREGPLFCVVGVLLCMRKNK